MATLTYTRTAVCAGGCHVTFDVSLNGSAAQSMVFDIDVLRQPISNLTLDERTAFSQNVFRVHNEGRTRAQIAAEFGNGVPVTVTI
jgi:hypothetical protein